MNSNVKYMVRSGVLLAIAIVFQFIGRNVPEISQFIVGPIVNAVLLITVVLCGTWWGAGVGILTPITALIAGQLPAILASFLPFIMLGNFIYIISFGLMRNYKHWGKYLGFIFGSFLKYAFLTLSSTELVHIFNINLPPKIITVMGVPQLVTALAGGVAAIILTELIKSKIDMEDHYGEY